MSSRERKHDNRDDASPNEPAWPYRFDQCCADALEGRCKGIASISPSTTGRGPKFCAYHFAVRHENAPPCESRDEWARHNDPADYDLIVLGIFPDGFDPTKRGCIDCHEQTKLDELTRGRCLDCWPAWRERKLEERLAIKEGKADLKAEGY